MRHAASAVPASGSGRPQAVVILTAVLLALLAALGTAGSSSGTPGEREAGTAAAVGHHQDVGPRADDECHASAMPPRTATRQEPHTEHPSLGGHATTDGLTEATLPQLPSLGPTGHLPSSRPHASHDCGRAPPALSGM
jgi:hypothetical protein